MSWASRFGLPSLSTNPLVPCLPRLISFFVHSELRELAARVELLPPFLSQAWPAFLGVSVQHPSPSHMGQQVSLGQLVLCPQWLGCRWGSKGPVLQHLTPPLSCRDVCQDPKGGELCPRLR